VPNLREDRVVTLWHLAWNDDRVACVIYRNKEGLELRLESAKGVILSERFDMQPRAMARTKTLRKSLLRRGWREA
jgi:hypothetical protein